MEQHEASLQEFRELSKEYIARTTESRSILIKTQLLSDQHHQHTENNNNNNNNNNEPRIENDTIAGNDNVQRWLTILWDDPDGRNVRDVHDGRHHLRGANVGMKTTDEAAGLELLKAQLAEKQARLCIILERVTEGRRLRKALRDQMIPGSV